VALEPAALDAAAAIAQGYPYSVQLIGDATWTIAGYPDTGRDLDVGVGSGRGAVSVFRLVRFLGPPAEPDVPVPGHPGADPVAWTL
jgi:hypothetical protein